MPEVVDANSASSEGERHNELAAVEARVAGLGAELHTAQAEVDRSAEALQMAERSVGAFESELSMRAGEDLQRMKRFAAAEQLRAQIEAVAGTLRRAEHDAQQAVERAGQAVVVAEAAFEHAAADVSDHARQARKLAEELPIDQRPDGDPLRSLVTLAERLAAHAEVLQPEIDRAEAAVAAAAAQLEEAMAARRLAGTGHDGPQSQDLSQGLGELLQADPTDTLLVLDEPFTSLSDDVRSELLEVVRTASASRPLVLLTEDAEVLGWAIELPADEAVALPAEALLARMLRSNQGLAPAASGGAVDITTSTTHPEPAPTAHRWAGQR